MTAGTLLPLQQQFQQHLLHGDQQVAQAIRPGGIGIERRLAIYHHAYRQRLVDTLRDTYGHTLLYMGDELFDATARQHVQDHASAHASLRDYGDGFDATLAACHPQVGELPELARLDRSLRHAFDGPDAPLLALSDLGALPPARWASVGFVLHPTFARLQLRHNTLALWQALDHDEDPPPALPLAEPGELLIWRRGQQPHFRSLQPLEAAALDALARGLSFAATGQYLSERFEQQATMAAELGALLRRWIDDELLTAFTP